MHLPSLMQTGKKDLGLIGLSLVLAFARGDVVFKFSIEIVNFGNRTGRYFMYFTGTVCIG